MKNWMTKIMEENIVMTVKQKRMQEGMLNPYANELGKGCVRCEVSNIILCAFNMQIYK